MQNRVHTPIDHIVSRIENYEPIIHKPDAILRYAGVAIIIRHLPDRPPEILYLLRAVHEHDKWSGHVAFPGGKLEPQDENIRATAMRETLEEVGIDLKSPAYKYLGRLNDLNIGFGVKMVVCPFVFLQTTQQEEPYKISESEVQSVRFISIEWLSQQLATLSKYGVRTREKEGKGVHGKDLTMPMNKYIPIFKYLSTSTVQRFGLTAKFPNICLHEHSSLSTKLAHELDEDYVLWGLTLKMTVHFFETAGVFDYYKHENLMDTLKYQLNGYSENRVINAILTSSLLGWYGESPQLTKLRSNFKLALCLFGIIAMILLVRFIST